MQNDKDWNEFMNLDVYYEKIKSSRKRIIIR